MESFIFMRYVDMRTKPLYMQGDIAGYSDGVRDANSGKPVDWMTSDLARLPIKAMALSSRATNCLMNYGCTRVEDVIQLSRDRIVRMRNLGPKTASEIAQWLIENGIVCTAWSEYI